MRVETSRFGAIEIADDRLFTFPEGLPGFEGKRFVVINEKRNPLIEWLQSTEEPDVAVMLIDPAELLLDYAVTPKPAEIRAVQPNEAEPERLTCRIIIRNADRPGHLYLNLFAPLLFNQERRLAMQVPLVGSGYGVREIWPPEPPTEGGSAR